MVDKKEFRDIITCVAPIVASKKAAEKYHLIFKEIDRDESGTLDRDEIRQACRLIDKKSMQLGVSFDALSDRMRDEADELSYDDFVQMIEEVRASSRHNNSMTARRRREAFIRSTYGSLLRSDGTFAVGSLRKGLTAIGLPLRTKARHDLLDLIKPSTRSQDDDDDDSNDTFISYQEFRRLLSAAVLHHGSDHYPMS